MKNSKIIFIPIVILLITSLFFVSNYIEKKKQNEIYQEKLKSYNEQIDKYLLGYSSNSGYIISNTSKEFIYIEDPRQKVVLQTIPTITDFDVEYNKDLKNYNDSNIEFLFANNKMTYLFDDILNNTQNDIYKYIFINYLENYSKKNSLILHPKIIKNVSYTDLLSLEKQLYTFNIANEEEYIDKFFLLSSIEKSGVSIDSDFKIILENSLHENFDNFKDEDKLLFLFYLNELGELDNFLSKKNEKLDELFGKFSLNKDNLAFYTYILSLKDSKNEKVKQQLENLEKNIDNLSDSSIIMLIGILNNLNLDYSKYYEKIESKTNSALSLKDQFIKFIVFSKLKNEYTNYDSYSKFWWSSGLQVNKRKEYILFEKMPFIYEIFSLDKVIYDELIDTRVGAFDGKKFYVNITLKQK